MRPSSLLLFLGVSASALAGCGDDRYRLGSARGDGYGAAEGAGGSGASARGGSPTGGRSGVAGTGSEGSESTRGTGGAAEALTRDIVLLQADPKVVSVLADEQYVYFNNPVGPVWRMDHSGSTLEKVSDGPANFLEMDGPYLYLASARGIQRVPKLASNAEVTSVLEIDLGIFPNTSNVAFDDSHIYVSTYTWGKTVVRAPKDGGTAQVMGRSSVGVYGVAVAENALFWVDYQEPDGAIVQRTDLRTDETALFHPDGAGQLLPVGADLWFRAPLGRDFVRAPRDGGAPRQYRAPNAFPPLASDGAHFFWAFRHVMRINLVTGVEEVVADLPLLPFCSGLAVTSSWLFVGANNQLYRIAKPAP